MNVYLAWCNDLLLGVYSTKEEAIGRIDRYRVANPHGSWYLVGGTDRPFPRWAQNSGRVSRLEVEEWVVL